MQKALREFFSSLYLDFSQFVFLLGSYCERKARGFGGHFETTKKYGVSLLLLKRGRFKRPLLHVGVGGFFALGMVAAPIFATTYPLITQQAELASAQSPSAVLGSATENDQLFSTEISSKPRDKIITYTVEKGDTLSTVADKFNVSTDTIMWQNDLKDGDSLSIGQELEILPVTGVSYKVLKGDTVYTIAKKLSTDAQKIVDFPFNDFSDPDTFALTPGQTLIVPDGQPVSTPKPTSAPKQTTYLAQGSKLPSNISTPQGGGGFAWPTQGIITQYPSWYHMAYDIANNAAPPVAAAKGGTVSYAACISGGYGCHIIIDHGDGWQTLYAHLQAFSVSKGDTVAQGKVIGRMGSTGKSTGTHLHFEIRKNGVLLNPMNFLK